MRSTTALPLEILLLLHSIAASPMGYSRPSSRAIQDPSASAQRGNQPTFAIPTTWVLERSWSSRSDFSSRRDKSHVVEAIINLDVKLPVMSAESLAAQRDLASSSPYSRPPQFHPLPGSPRARRKDLVLDVFEAEAVLNRMPQGEYNRFARELLSSSLVPDSSTLTIAGVFNH